MTREVREPENTLTVTEAAERLGCNPNTVRRWADKGRLVWVKDAWPSRIATDEVERERAALLHSLGVGDQPAAVIDEAEQKVRRLRTEVDSLRRQLADALETARVLLMSDTAKNDLVRQYLYRDAEEGFPRNS